MLLVVGSFQLVAGNAKKSTKGNLEKRKPEKLKAVHRLILKVKTIDWNN